MEDGRELLIAWLHDPPDKALDIRGHVGRACRYLSAALAAPVDSSDLQGHHADQLASATERLPMPKWDAEPAALVGADEVQLIHPLAPSCVIRSPDGATEAVREEEVQQVIAELVDGVDDPSSRFHALWRQLPDRLARIRPLYGRLPADTRVPDHTVWQHLDTTAGIHTVLADPHGGVFLSFSIGPVQSFIAAARTVRDLWTGSMILSWLTFRAMLPIVEQLGPTAMVYPSLRGIPLLDLWLNRREALHGKLTPPEQAARKSPCIPNRFVAMVPWGEAGGRAVRLADDCRAAAAGAWRELAGAVHDELARKLTGESPGWDRHWNAQVDGFFDLRTSLVPWRACTDSVLANLLAGTDDFATAFPEAAAVRQLETAVPESHRVNYPQRSAGQWQFRLELSARALEADKAIRQVPPPAQFAPGERVPAKCSMMGNMNRWGPPIRPMPPPSGRRPPRTSGLAAPAFGRASGSARWR